VDPALRSGGPIPAEVVIPLRWSGGQDGRVEEMTRYLQRLHRWVECITVVDGSEPLEREAHERAWGDVARVLEPDADLQSTSLIPVCRLHETSGRAGGAPGWNGKVVGALTGIRRARREVVILADDDVRHTRATIERLLPALDAADLVRPMNVYDAWPWQARWDGARILLNTAVACDWPGTFALRRSVLLRAGGWCPHVLFENLEMWRTVQAAGGRLAVLPDIGVPRQPPSALQFRSQRVRQAYDDFAQPARLLAELAILPLVLLVARRRPLGLGVLATLSVVLAERGRRRVHHDVADVPPDVPLWAPVWLVERGVCVWVALGCRLRGGVRYHGRRLRLAAHSSRQLRRAHARQPAGATAAPMVETGLR
jgi:hypothetical protein